MSKRNTKAAVKRVLPIAVILVAFACFAALLIPYNASGNESREAEYQPYPPVKQASAGSGRKEILEAEQEAPSAVEEEERPYTLENYWQEYEQEEDKLLVLVNGKIPLPEEYDPQAELYDGVPVGGLMYDSLCSLLQDARADGAYLWVASGYRDIREQEALLQEGVENRMREYGLSEEEARENALRSFSVPGFSEHHTGLAVDFNGVNREFQETGEYRWLTENAWKYGFIQRYPEDKTEITGIIHEPWHYRYVGREHAKRMRLSGLCLEEYIVELKNTGT